MSRQLLGGIGFFFFIFHPALPTRLWAEDQQKNQRGNAMIECYFESNNDRPGKTVRLTESMERIEFTDVIGPDHGGGDGIEGQIIENGKVVLLKIYTGMQHKNEGTSISTQFHYIDSTLLPRKIPVEGMLLKGSVVVRRLKQ